MLEPTRPYGAPVRPFMAAQISFGVAREAWQARGYWALRREIFCAETQLFDSAGAERDVHDRAALPIVSDVVQRFAAHGVDAAIVAELDASGRLDLAYQGKRARYWNLSHGRLLGFGSTDDRERHHA